MDFGVGSPLIVSSNGSEDAFVLIATPYVCTPPDLPNPQALNTNICIGSSTKAYVANLPDLGGAAYWQWYTGSCGGTAVGQGDTLPISPTASETYYVRGEGGCITSPGMCGQVSVTVGTSVPTVTVSQNANTLTVAQAGAIYQWIDCNNGNQPISGATSQDYTLTVSGNYACVVSLVRTDTSACTTVTIVAIDPHQLSAVSIYPNPAHDCFHR
ncbi:MAG: hypothetical protein U0176_00330 [Bacteroidia bacterium]